MSFKELLQFGTPINITVSLADLQEWSSEIIEKALNNITPIQEKNEKTLLTTAEASKLLQVDRCTLYRWEREGYLPTYRIGNRKRYKMEDIERLTAR